METTTRKRSIQEVEVPEAIHYPASKLRFTDFEALGNVDQSEDGDDDWKESDYSDESDTSVETTAVGEDRHHLQGQYPAPASEACCGSEKQGKPTKNYEGLTKFRWVNEKEARRKSSSSSFGLQGGSIGSEHPTGSLNGNAQASKDDKRHGAKRLDGVKRLAFPKSWAEATEMDRILYRMKKEGSSWEQICHVWRKHTGYGITKKGIAKRYLRLREDLPSSKGKEMERQLAAAVVEVVARFAKEKWRLVAEAMSRNGTEISEEAARSHFEQMIARNQLPTDNTIPKQEQSMAGVSGVAGKSKVNGITPAPSNTTALSINNTRSAQTHVSDKPKLASTSSSKLFRQDSSTERSSARSSSRRDNDNLREGAVALDTKGDHTRDRATRLFVPDSQDKQGFDMQKSRSSTASRSKDATPDTMAPTGLGKSNRFSGLFSPSELEAPAISVSNPIKEIPKRPLPYCIPLESQPLNDRGSTVQSSSGSVVETKSNANLRRLEKQAVFPFMDKSVGNINSEDKSSFIQKKATAQAPQPIVIEDEEPNTHNESSRADNDRQWHAVNHKHATPPVTSSPHLPNLPSAVPGYLGASYNTATTRSTPPIASHSSPLDETPRTRARRGRPPKWAQKPKPETEPINSSQESFKSKHSEIMKAAWARRKMRGTDGRYGGPRVSKNPARHSTLGDSAPAFAASVLAAAAAQTESNPTPPPEASEERTDHRPRGPPIDLENEPVDLLTGESIFAHQDDQDEDLPQVREPIPAKKIVRRNFSFRQS